MKMLFVIFIYMMCVLFPFYIVLYEQGGQLYAHLVELLSVRRLLLLIHFYIWLFNFHFCIYLCAERERSHTH